MEKLARAFGASMMFTAMILIWAPFSVGIGWLAGWTVSAIYGDSILRVLAKFGISGITLPQIGMTLGFVSQFLRTKVETGKR